MAGLRAKVAMTDPSDCAVADVSAATGASVGDITWTRGGDQRVTEEFRVDGDTADEAAETIADAEPVVRSDGETVFWFTRPREDDAPTCACEAIEALGCPVADVHAEDGTLVFTLHLTGSDELRDVLDSLRPFGDGIDLRYVVHAEAGSDDNVDAVVVDRGRLTERQREVLRTAYEMGYFDYPRTANASEVADSLGIGLSTFTEHLATAQAKLLDDLVDA